MHPPHGHFDLASAKQQVMALVQHGRLDEARKACSELCRRNPTDAESMFLMAAIAGQQSDFATAEKYSSKALKFAPHHPAAQYNYAFSLLKQGKMSKAEAAYRSLVGTSPNFAEAHNDLGYIQLEAGHAKQALGHFMKAIAINPGYAIAHFNAGRARESMDQPMEARKHHETAARLQPALAEAQFRLGNLLYAQKEFKGAATFYERAISARAHYPEAHNNLGNTHLKLGDIRSAILAYRNAISCNPEYAEAYNNLGNALKDDGQLEESITQFNHAIRLRTDFAEAHFNLGTSFHAKGNLTDAERAYRKAVEIRPMAQAYNNLGNLHVSQGQVLDAIEDYRTGLAMQPEANDIHSNLLFALNYVYEMDHLKLYEEHRDWERIHGYPATSSTWPNVRSPDRTLVIGYVSPDLHGHSVAYFFESILRGNADDNGIYSICYSDTVKQDKVTERLHRLSDKWHDIAGLTDEEAARLIRNDKVDILVDLTGHTSGNRLTMFTLKAAPIQMSHIGYPNTTGLSAIDYRITDNTADPAETVGSYSESLLRLPGCFLCYTPPSCAQEISIGAPPVIDRGHITFASFNNLAKLNEQTIHLWAKILGSLPNSRIILKSRALSDPETRERYRSMFAAEGIEPERINLLSWTPSMKDHLELYQQVDIALDTYPYNGTTTTCEALLMGVPVLSLYGESHASRVGLSLLTAVGMDHLATQDESEFVAMATRLGNDLDSLSRFRAELRDRVLESALCDTSAYHTDLARLYRNAWNTWVQNCRMTQ